MATSATYTLKTEKQNKKKTHKMKEEKEKKHIEIDIVFFYLL